MHCTASKSCMHIWQISDSNHNHSQITRRILGRLTNEAQHNYLSMFCALTVPEASAASVEPVFSDSIDNSPRHFRELKMTDAMLTFSVNWDCLLINKRVFKGTGPGNDAYQCVVSRSKNQSQVKSHHVTNTAFHTVIIQSNWFKFHN